MTISPPWKWTTHVAGCERDVGMDINSWMSLLSTPLMVFIVFVTPFILGKPSNHVSATFSLPASPYLKATCSRNLRVQRGIPGAFGILNLFSAVTTRGSVRGSLSMVRIASVDIYFLFKVTMNLITIFIVQFIALPIIQRLNIV